MPERFIRRRVLVEMIGVGYTTIHRWIGLGQFPMPYRLNPNGGGSAPVAWKQSEIEAWMQTRERGFEKGIPHAWEARRKAARDKREGLEV